MQIVSEAAMEARARRAAKKAGLKAIKSRWRLGTVDNKGKFQIIDPYYNTVKEGLRYDMSAEEVIAFCQPEADE
jgi:hypothetical protein